MRLAIDNLREQLLDVSKRNRLLNFPVGSKSAKQLGVTDELSDELFKILYAKARKMTFEPSPDAVATETFDDSERVRLSDEPDPRSSGPAAHQVDAKLRTPYSPQGLQTLSSSFVSVREGRGRWWRV